MKQITREMLKIYKPLSNLDWMNYRIVKKNLTFHHIKKKVDGGKEIISNGALLIDLSHRYLHLIEYRDIKTYEALNQMFRYINQQRQEPTEEQREIIETLLCQFEKEHRWDKNKKGKLLIKYSYKKRW